MSEDNIIKTFSIFSICEQPNEPCDKYLSFVSCECVDRMSISFVVAMGDLSLRKADVDEKRAKVQKDSKALLEYTRKAIAKLNDLKK